MRNPDLEELLPDRTGRWLAGILGAGCLALLAAVIAGGWWWRSVRAEREAAEAEREALEQERHRIEERLAVDTDPRIVAIVDDLGFHTLVPGPWPLVGEPPNADMRGSDWHMTEVHGGGLAQGSMAGRGILVAVADGTPTVDPAHHSLPDERRAEKPDEVAWVALVRRTTIADHFDYRGIDVDVERVDARLVRVSDGRLAAQVTMQSVPPLSWVRPRESYPIDHGFVARSIVDALGQPELTVALELPVDPAELCPDVLTPMHRTLDTQRVKACIDTPLGDECARHCERGHPESCLDIAYALDAAAETGDPAARDGANDHFVKACVFGERSGCVDWAAGFVNDPLRTDDAESDPALACAARLFEQACAEDLSWGCGMRGRALALGHGVERDIDGANELLTRSCEQLGGGACASLGILRARGAFGPEAVATADDAFEKGCDMAIDPTACGYVASDYELDLLPGWQVGQR